MAVTEGVTFETKCWEADWRAVLDPRHIESILSRHLNDFQERRILVNNVNDPASAMAAAQQLVKSGLMTSAVFVPEYVEPCLASFGLTAQDLGKGYWYSTAELVGIRLCTTQFLVHYASDSVLASRSDWVARGCSLLNADKRIACVNPLWNGRLREALSTSVESRGEYEIGRGFSDQCYLIEPERWRALDLRHLHAASDRYPDYAKGLFEMRADSAMRFDGLLRATDCSVTYVHPVVPGSV